MALLTTKIIYIKIINFSSSFEPCLLGPYKLILHFIGLQNFMQSFHIDFSDFPNQCDAIDIEGPGVSQDVAEEQLQRAFSN